jgi:hypothetical protein
MRDDGQLIGGSGEAAVKYHVPHARQFVAATIALATVILVSACATSGTGKPSAASSSSGAAHGGHGRAAPAAAPLRAGERFVNVSMSQPYTPTAPNGGTDEYRCFLVDPGLTSQAFLTGSQFLPQNADIVHHAIFFRVDPAGVEAARKADADAPGDGWTCFGDAGIGDKAAWVAAWAPGGNETLLNAKVGFPMPAGSQLVMQVHYNLLATNGKAGAADRSGIRLRLAEPAAGLQPLDTQLLPAPVEVPCAAGESGPLCDRTAAVADVTKRFGDEIGNTAAGLNKYCNNGAPPVAGPTQHCDHKVRKAGTLYGLFGHMHLLGRSIKVELNPGTPTAQTLLDVPAYNFDDQAMRPLAKPVAVKPGDTYRVTCTHDVSLRKQLPQLRDLPARYVVWGDGTSDEMCLGVVTWSPAA